MAEAERTDLNLREGAGAEASGSGARGGGAAVGAARVRNLACGAAALLGHPPRVQTAALALLWRGGVGLPTTDGDCAGPWAEAAPCPHPEEARAALGALLLAAKVEEVPLRVGDAVNAVLWLDVASCGELGPGGTLSAAAQAFLCIPDADGLGAGARTEPGEELGAEGWNDEKGGLFVGSGGPWVGQRYEVLRPGALEAEWELLSRCRCVVSSDSPMKYLLNFCARRRYPRDTVALAVAFLNDGIKYAGLLETFKPQEAAAGALFLSLGGDAGVWEDFGTNLAAVRRVGAAVLDALEPFRADS